MNYSDLNEYNMVSYRIQACTLYHMPHKILKRSVRDSYYLANVVCGMLNFVRVRKIYCSLVCQVEILVYFC